ncbi:ribonuclease HI [Glutamicibacter sp.]|uniref:ribonuclease HI n=1 Tax=Glutamicibacter sp. TaxID=1931995 RepID=UPI003D6B73C2
MSLNAEAAGDLLSRPIIESTIPRVPDAFMMTKPFHASIISWTMPEIAGNGGMVYWLFSISHEDGTLTSHSSASDESMPLPIMLRELEQLLGQYREQTWICVPTRNRNIARYFAESGYAVTRGLNPINRAAREIEQLVGDAKLSLTRRAQQRHRLRESPVRSVSSRTHDAAKTEKIQWHPEFWSTSHVHPERIVIGVDASADPSGAGSIAMITGHGDVVVYAGEFFGHMGALELRAVILALEYLQGFEAASAVIHTDSEDAYRIIEELITTGRYVDGYRGIGGELCLEFLAAWNACSAEVVITRHRGHTGLIYNEVADELAWMARAAAKLPRHTSEPELLERIRLLQIQMQERNSPCEHSW